MKTGANERKTTLGVLCADPLRMLGLETLLGEHFTLEPVRLDDPSTLQHQTFAMLVLDTSATEQALSLIQLLSHDLPSLRILVLGQESSLEHMESIIGAGAKGYLQYAAGEGELRMAVDIVLSGSVWAPRRVLARLLERSRQQPAAQQPGAKPTLTQRELQVLRLLLAGQPNREIASALGVDEGTVKAHVGRLMRKMGVANRTALTMQAIAHQLG